MEPLPTVYGYSDAGAIVEDTRWEPRKILCTKQSDHSDAPGMRYAIKFRRGTPESAAMAISEVIGHCLLQSVGIRTFEAALIDISSDLARSYAEPGTLDYGVAEGLHFGTKFDIDTDSGPPTQWEQMAEPQELVAIWVFDSWTLNIDRENEGNLRLLKRSDGRFSLLAADQSDLFLGAGRFAAGEAFKECGRHGPANYKSQHYNLWDMVQRTIAEHGSSVLAGTIDAIKTASKNLDAMIAHVPAAWWSESGVAPANLVDCLVSRAERLGDICRLKEMEGLYSEFNKYRSLL